MDCRGANGWGGPWFRLGAGRRGMMRQEDACREEKFWLEESANG